MAERHWREFRPKMVRELEAKGTLMEALFEAQETTINEMEALTRQLETEQKLTPQQAHDQAWEMIREKYILLPPEENLELNARNYRIRAEDRLGDGSLKQKCRDNFAAIELVRLLDSQSRAASDEEKRILVKYVGWGGIPQVFASPLSTEWKAEGERLKVLLTSEEYEAARASTLNAHYTSATVISAIYDAVERIGFTHGRVLEPALGIGNFFGLMPGEMSARSRLTGIEIDPLTAKIARQLYPDADIRAQGFETAALGDGSFDLAISNVPFGDYKLHDPSVQRAQFSRSRLLLRESGRKCPARWIAGLRHVQRNAR